MRNKLLTVVGAALILGLLAIGTVTVAGSPGGPSPQPKPEPPPQITPAQIVDGVNRLLPHVVSRIPPPPPEIDGIRAKLPPEMMKAPRNRMPSVGAVPPGVRLFAARAYDDGVILGRGGGTALGAIELDREYKLGDGLLKQGLYAIAAISDPKNELDKAIDPENKIDFYLALVRELGAGQLEIVALIGLPHRELARVMGMVDERVRIKFAQLVLLNLVGALLQ